MRIERIEIKGFGKYKDFTLDIGEGMHVLYGQNEAGKTTLQNFIVAMLFGMKKPGKKRTVYHENHTRYVPWDGKYYGGKLQLTIDGTGYIIERNFIKNRDDCKIFRTDSGEDVTNQFPEDNRKERQFLQTLLGIDELMFKNALCLGDHLRSEWDEWRTETAPKLVSGSHLQTADQALIQKAEAVLKQQIEEIGSERAESKPLGQAVAKRRDLDNQLRKAEEQEHSISELCEELDAQTLVCNQKHKEWIVGKQMTAGRIAQLQASLQSDQITLQTTVDGAVEVAASSESISDENYQQQRANVYRNLEGYRSVYQERLNYSARIQEVQQLDQESLSIVQRYQTITEQDVQQVDEFEQHLLADNRDTQDAALGKNSANGTAVQGASGWNRPLLTAGMAVIVLGIAGYMLHWTLALLLVAVGAVLTVLSRFKGKQTESARADMEAVERTTKKQHTAQLEQQLQLILQRFDADTPRQARTRWQQILQARERVASQQQQVAWLEKELDKAESRLRQEWDSIQTLCGSSEPWLEQLPDAVDHIVQEWEARAINDLHYRKAGQQIHQLKAEIIRWAAIVEELGVEPLPVQGDQSIPSRDEIEAELRSVSQLERLYRDQQAKQNALEVKVQTLREGRRGMAELARDLEAWSQEQAQLSKSKKALETAAAAFEEVRQVMYREQAPVLVQKVTALAQQFTAGRYTDLKVDNQMQIRLTSPESGYTFEMDGLSKGTWDQLNFALALAVSESVVLDGNKLPLLIDEPFLHYDDERMQTTVEYLLQLAGMRQILFFTHRQHDVDTLQKLGGSNVLLHKLVR